MEAGEGDELEDESKRRAISLDIRLSGERGVAEQRSEGKEKKGQGSNPCLARSQMNDLREASVKP